MKDLRAVIFLSLVLFLPSLSLSQTAGGTVSEQQDYAFAIGLYRDGQYPLALREFKSYLHNYPGSQRVDEVTFLVGECLLQERMYDSALSYYQKVEGTFPGSPYFMRSKLRSGEIYLQLQKFSRAEDMLKDVLSNSEDDNMKGEASYKLGQLFVSENDYNNAIKYFDLTYQGYGSSQFADYAMYGSAWSFGKQGDFAKSKGLFEDLLVKYPDTKLRGDATEKIGECDYFLGDYGGAVDRTKQALSMTEDDQVAEPGLYYQGRSCEALGLPDSAMQTYSEYISRFPSSAHSQEVRVLYAKLLISGKTDITRALTLLGQVTPDSPVYFDSRLEVARAYEATGASDTAQSILLGLAQASGNPNRQARAYFELGKLYFQSRSYKKSEESFVLASKDDDLYPQAMKSAAVSAAAGNDFANAKLYFLNAISRLKGADSFKAHLDYAAALYAADDFQGAAQIYTTAIDISPSDSVKSESLYMAAESFYRAGAFQESAADYKKYFDTYPNGPRAETALLGYGYAQYFSDDFANAALTFQSFIQKYPSSRMLSDAYLRMGDCYFYGKDYNRALGIYQDATSRFAGDTSSAYAWYQAGQTQFKLGQFSEALNDFRFVLGKFPSSTIAPEALYAVGWVYFSQKNYDDAVSNFTQAVRDYPMSPVAARALYSKGDSYYNEGKYEDALSSYRQLLEKYPTSQYVDNAIVGMQYCLTVLGRSKEAGNVIDTFVKEHPSLPNVDRIYYKKVEYALNQKKYPEAEHALREFLFKFQKSPLAPKALYNLAVVERELGKDKSAIGFLSDLIARVPATEYTTAAQVKLAEIYARRKDYTEAEKLLNDASASSNDYSTAAQVDLGKVFLEQGDTLRAESSFSKAALSQTDSVNDGDKAEAKVLLSGIYFRKGRSADAISLANSVAKTRDDLVGAEAQLRVAEYYCASGDSSNAVLSFLRVKYVFPSFTDVVAESQLELADCLFKFGNVNDAKSLLQQFIKGRTNDSFEKEAREKLQKLKSR